MHRLIFIISIVVNGLHSAKSADLQSTNNITTELETNSPVCAISIDYSSGQEKPLPVCYVRLINNSTDNRVSGLQLPPEMLFTIDLFDAKGQQVEKSEFGKKYGKPLSQQEINDWFRLTRKGRGGWSGWFWIPGHSEVGNISIPQTFKLTQAGEYTLHLRMRLIQTSMVDPSGAIRRKSVYDGQYFRPDKSGQISFQITWLSEVTAKVQIRPEDIQPTDLLQNVQTNSPSK
jgi:hypothetical protein